MTFAELEAKTTDLERHLEMMRTVLETALVSIPAEERLAMVARLEKHAADLKFARDHSARDPGRGRLLEDAAAFIGNAGRPL